MDTSETVLYYSIVVVTAILMVFLWIFYRSTSWVQKKFMEEHTGRIEAEVLSMERERKRVAEDLHDETGGMIYDILRKAEAIKPGNEEEQLLKDQLVFKIRQMDEAVQEITDGLLPLNLQQNGIANAIEDMVIQRQGMAGIHIRLETENIVLDEARSLHLYRVVQECMNNAIKHSKATYLAITLIKERDNILLRVSDNGVGFKNVAMPGQQPGRGLESIYNRIRFLGGDVQLNSLHGCEWIFTLPAETKK